MTNFRLRADVMKKKELSSMAILSLKCAMNQITVHQARTFSTCLPSGWMHLLLFKQANQYISTLFILIFLLPLRADEWPSGVHTCGHLITRLCKFYYYTMIFYSRITALWWDFTHPAKLAVISVILYIAVW